MSERTAILSFDEYSVEIPTSLTLSKKEMVEALVYIPPGSSYAWTPEMAARYVASMEILRADRAIMVISEVVIHYGQGNIGTHKTPDEVMSATRAAVERLWPDLR